MEYNLHLRYIRENFKFRPVFEANEVIDEEPVLYGQESSDDGVYYKGAQRKIKNFNSIVAFYKTDDPKVYRFNFIMESSVINRAYSMPQQLLYPILQMSDIANKLNRLEDPYPEIKSLLTGKKYDGVEYKLVLGTAKVQEDGSIKITNKIDIRKVEEDAPREEPEDDDFVDVGDEDTGSGEESTGPGDDGGDEYIDVDVPEPTPQEMAVDAETRKKDALKIIKEKVGGDFKSASRLSAFSAITKALNLLNIEDIDENGEEVKEIFLHLSKKENIEFLNKFIRNQKGRVASLKSKIKKARESEDNVDFKKEINVAMNVIERTFKLHSIIKNNISSISTETEEEKKKNTAIINKLEKSLKSCESTIAEKIKIIQDEGKKEIEEAAQLEDTAEAEEKIVKVEQTFTDLGLKDLISELINQIRSEFSKKEDPKEKIEKEKDAEKIKKRQSISKKKIIINKILESFKIAMLPELMGDEVKTEGGYYALYKALRTKNGILMKEVVLNKIFKPDQKEEKDSFMNVKDRTESGSEEDQLTYLNACREWTKQYILSDQDGQLESQRDIEKLLAEVDNIADEKEKEIRNYYTAKDFNLGQFKGLQIKPEIYLPLCLSRSRSEAECKIKLAVSYKDRVDESPLKKFYLAASSIVGGLFANIPDTGDKAFAQAMADRNQAIMNGISSIISGTLGIFSKQASRDYEEGLKNFKKRVGDTLSNPKVSEDMVAMPTQGATQPGQFLQTPDSVPSGMDTFALLGPGGTGKKPSKKKKKPMKTIPQKGGVLTFDDFLKRSKNTK